MRALILALVLVLSWLPARAADAAPEFGPSISYDAGDPVFRIADLRGKMAIILLAQSWCPVCNGWSDRLLQSLEKAWAGDPRVILVFIKTDGDAAGAKAYLRKQGADPERWLVAADAEAAWTKTALGKDELWQCLVLDPAGRMVQENTKAGQHWSGGDKQWLLVTSKPLPVALAAASTRLPAGTATAPAMARARRLAELGLYGEAMAAVPRTAPRPDTERLRTAIGLAADAEVGRLATAASAAASAGERYGAYTRLRRLAGLKGLPAAQAARTAMAAAEKTPGIQAELAAERAWSAVLQRAQRVPQDKRAAALAEARTAFQAAHPDSGFAAGL